MDRKKTEKLEKGLIKTFLALAVIMFVYLVSFSIIFSYENIIFRYQEVFRVNDNILLNIVGAILLYLLMLTLAKGLMKVGLKNMDYIVLGVGIISSVIAIIWIYICGSIPGADAERLCDVASQMNSGDYSSLEKGQYIGLNQHQLGMVTILRVLYQVFGNYNYNSFRVLSALSIALLIYSGYKVAGKLSNGNSLVQAFYCVISFFCLPMYFYVPHVYGEMIYTALIVFSFWMVMDLIEKISIFKIILLAMSVFFAAMACPKTGVAIIAIISVLIVKSALSKRKSLIILIGVILISYFSQSLIISSIYNKYIPDDSKTMPPLCYMAMGLNEDNNMAGWYNQDNRRIFEESEYNPEVANEIAKEVINERVINLVNNPARFVHFYIKKVSSQWLAPMWQSIAMNNVIDGSEAKIAHEIYFNEGVSNGINRVMDFYLIIVYATSLLWLICCFKAPEKLENYLIPITAFGGFLLSIIWEAKTRYTLPYYLMIIIISAVGAGCLDKLINKYLIKHTDEKNNENINKYAQKYK